MRFKQYFTKQLNIRLDDLGASAFYSLKNCNLLRKKIAIDLGWLILFQNTLCTNIRFQKFIGHFTIDIFTLIASDILLNSFTSLVKCSGAVCLHFKMATLELDLNLTYFNFRGLFKRTFEASKVPKICSKLTKNSIIHIFPQNVFGNGVNQSKTSTTFCAP